MKKIFPVLLLLLIQFSVNAQVIPSESRFVVVNSKNINISATEESWLPEAVCSRIEENFQNYTDFIFVNANLDAVKKFQKQTENAAYDEQEAIETGKISVAKYAIFVTIRKSDKYVVTGEVTDLTTGRKYATASSSEKTNVNELWSKSGCAADEVTLKLCEKLEISLTNAQKNLLLPEKENVSGNTIKPASENKKEKPSNISKTNKSYEQDKLYDVVIADIVKALNKSGKSNAGDKFYNNLKIAKLAGKKGDRTADQWGNVLPDTAYEYILVRLDEARKKGTVSKYRISAIKFDAMANYTISKDFEIAFGMSEASLAKVINSMPYKGL